MSPWWPRLVSGPASTWKWFSQVPCSLFMDSWGTGSFLSLPPLLPSVMTVSEKLWWIKGKTGQQASDPMERKAEQRGWQGTKDGLQTAWHSVWSRTPLPENLVRLSTSHLSILKCTRGPTPESAEDMYQNSNTASISFTSHLSWLLESMVLSGFWFQGSWGTSWQQAQETCFWAAMQPGWSNLVPQWSPSLHLLASPLPFLQDVKNLQ